MGELAAIHRAVKTHCLAVLIIGVIPMQTSPLGPTELGAIKNYLKILSDDKKGFRPAILREITGLTPQDLSKSTGVPRPRLYSDVVKFKPASELMRKILHVVIATDEAYELMNNNAANTFLWISSPSSVFMGYSPFEICMQGRGEEVISWLRTRMGKQPGAGF